MFGRPVSVKAPKAQPLHHQLTHARARGDFDAVLSLSEKSLARVPDSPAVRRSLARTLVQLGRSDDAQPHWAFLLRNDARDFEAAFHIAKARVAGGRSIDAALDTVAPSDSPFRMNLTAVLNHPVAERRPDAGIRHVAICGVSFCGSTFLDRVLAGLPGVRSIGESHWLTKARYGHKDYDSIDFTLPERQPMAYCSVCGPSCKFLSYEFRRDLAADHTDWYQTIAHRLQTRILVSADKNLPKLIDNDPLLRFDALVLFKSPRQAWISHLNKQPADRGAEHYSQECARYAENWARAYGAFIEHLKPSRGKVVFMCFDAFVDSPLHTMTALCRLLGLPFSSDAIERTQPGHAIGGNRSAMQSLRENGYRVQIRPLPSPELDNDQARIIDNHADMQRVFATMKDAHDRQFGTARDSARPGGEEKISRPALEIVTRSHETAARQTVQKDRTAPRVSPADLGPKVGEQYHPGIFGDFRSVLEKRIAALRATDHDLNLERARFFEYLLNEVDADQYARIQDRCLDPAHLEVMTIKYLDPINWFESKVALARRLRLRESPPLRILDIGTGPGHFPVVARFYGHDVIGTDLPGRVSDDDNLYSALCNVYGVKRIGHTIRAFEELDDLPGRFDLVTGFLTAFNIERGQPWTPEQWRFFLRSLKQHALTESGSIFFALTQGKMSDASWRYLASISDWNVEQSKQISITDFRRLQEDAGAR